MHRVLLLIVSIALLGVSACGREASRYLGAGLAQTLTIPAGSQFINVSFDKPADGGSTIKNVTYKASNGYVYTQEFKDLSPLEGLIRWVPNSEGSDLIQSRALSRLTGDVVNLALPEDCTNVLGVDVGAASSSERVKNVTCRMKDGTIKTKEYREGLIDRNFSGWLEVRTAK